MADRLTFLDANAEYKPYFLGAPAVYDQSFDAIDDFPWINSDGNDPSSFEDFWCYGGTETLEETIVGDFPNEDFSTEDSNAFLSRARASTLDSQPSFDGFVPADGSASAKAKQAQRRQDAKMHGQFRCTYEDCPRFARPFGSSSDRRRHLAELHGFDPNQAFQLQRPCPWPQCARAEKSFKRQKNLDEHLTKKHAGQRPETMTEPSVPANSTDIRLSSSLPQPQTAPLMSPRQSLLASPQLRAKRLERSKRRDHLKQRIAHLQQRGREMEGEIGIVRLEFHQLENKLNHMQVAEKTNAQIIQTLKNQMAQEDIQDFAPESAP